MGRPRQFDRDAAIDTAMAEIWKHGYEASSVKSLSEALGITRSSFYNAFGDREALFAAVLERYFRGAPDRALVEFDQVDSPLQLLAATFREVCRVRAADPQARGCLAVNCVAELAGSDTKAARTLEAALAEGLAHIRALLERAVTVGEIDGDADIDGLALAVQTLLAGINLMSRVVRSEGALWGVARLTLDGLGLYRQ